MIHPPRRRTLLVNQAQPLVVLPARYVSPLQQLLHRLLLIGGILVFTTLLVWFDRGSYADNVRDDGVDLLDAFYYATVTMTTTGYGDITPVAPHARFLNALVITPLRIIFVVLLVGATLEVLATEGRRVLRDTRWRRNMRNHIVVIGYGTKGRSAVATLRKAEVPAQKILVIDPRSDAVAIAGTDGLAVIQGDGTHRNILRRAEISRAREVIITMDRDDAAILATLTVRQLNPSAHVVASVREHDNGSLIRQSGADEVVTSSDAVGRLMGLSSLSPHVGTVLEDLLTSGDGLEVHQRRVHPDEVGQRAEVIGPEKVVAVVRNDVVRRYYDPAIGALQSGDLLVAIRKAEAPTVAAPRELPQI